MTACSNRKGRAGRVITAALVGALSVGAPAVALATGGGIDLQFVEPSGAFEGGTVTAATFSQVGTGQELTPNAKDIYEIGYQKDKPVLLENFTISFFTTGATDTFKISITSGKYEVAYYKRDANGNATGDAIKSEVSEVGNYVAVVSAVSGEYAGGKVSIPFDINPIELENVKVIGNKTPTYNAEDHEFEFYNDVDDDGVVDPGEKLYSSEYDVEYVRTGHDGTSENVKDVNEVGNYRAKLTGKGNYAGTVELSEVIEVKELVLDNATFVGLTSSASSVEPKNLFAILIDGVWYTGDDPVMAQIQAQLDDKTQVWFDNDTYKYIVSAANPDEGNVSGTNSFDAKKVSYDLAFSYDGVALADSYEVVASDSKTHIDPAKFSGHAADTTSDGYDVEGYAPGAISMNVYTADGTKTNFDDLNNNVGTYAIVLEHDSADGKVGGVDIATVTTYQEAVNADAKAAVLYNGVVVSSVSETYDGSDVTDDIKVVVEDSAGKNVVGQCSVKYYNAEGREVGEIVDAGTYTLKVTSDTYKLTGTTEMTITVGKLDVSEVRSNALVPRPFYQTNKSDKYLVWTEDGYAIDKAGALPGLELQYKDAEGNWVAFPLNNVKATIFDASGKEVNKVTDEGVYTIKFEGRNATATNNYVIPADLVIECIKAEHLMYADVTYTDYFADAVAEVSRNTLMNGYGGTDLFGTQDSMKRGDVAVVLHNLATLWNANVDEDGGHFTEDEGYDTGFDDVDGHKYYAQSILWAKQSGVINGDKGTNNFRPEDKVSRQEFAAMLANFASKYDRDFKPAGDGALDAVSDADEVSAWAEESVAWAVENGIMGNAGSLWPTADIKRADVAGMLYMYALEA